MKTEMLAEEMLSYFTYHPFQLSQLCESLIAQVQDTTSDYYHNLRLLMADAYTKLLNNRMQVEYHTLDELRREEGVSTRRLSKAEKDEILEEQLKLFEARAIDVYSALLHIDKYEARCIKGLGHIAYYTEDYQEAKQRLESYLLLDQAANKRYITLLINKCNEKL